MALLHVRAYWGSRAPRERARARPGTVLTISVRLSPSHWIAAPPACDSVDAEAGNPARLSRGWRPDPEFDAFGHGVGEGELLAIGAPDRSAEFSIARQRDGDVLSSGQPLDRQRDVIGRHVHAVGVSIDADARQRQKRLRDLSDGRISHALH